MILPILAERKPATLLFGKLLGLLAVIGTVVYLALFVFNVITRIGHFSPDGMNYVNVARNIVAGKGITQPTLGFNQKSFPVDAQIPAPLVANAPLYPMLIALVSRLGISSTKSALLLSAAAYALIFFFIYRLTAELYDRKVALTAVGILLFYEPLRKIGRAALTDVPGTLFLLLSFWFLLKRRTERKKLFLVLAGLAAGSAFATRYAFLPLFGVIVLFLLIDCRGWSEKVTEVSLCALGFLLPAGLVWSHNFATSGSIMPYTVNPPAPALVQRLIETRMLFDRYLGKFAPQFQVGLLLITVLVFCCILIARNEFIRAARDLFLSRRRYILILWGFGYTSFLIAVWSYSYSSLEERYLVPIGIALVMLWSALAIKATRLPMVWVRSAVTVLLVLAISREALISKRTPPLDLQDSVRRSERLTWLANYTSNDDLIIGDNTIDIPFFLNRKATVSFSSFPYTDRATYEGVVGYARKHCREYRNIYLVLRTYPATEQEWRIWYGDFFADLVFGHIEKYPDIIVGRPLSDGYIFQIVCL